MGREDPTSYTSVRAGGSKEGCSLRRNTLTAELLAEFLGTFTLLIFGLGVVAHFVLRNAVGDPTPAPGLFGNFTTVNFAWGFGVVMGVYVAGGVSGAHINPAVTTSLALRRDFPWAKVGPYILAQVLGAFVAALLIRWNFYEWFNQVDPGKTFATQGIYSTSPGPGLSVLGGLRSEIIGTAMLMMLILAITHARNTPPGANLAPFIIGLAVVVIGMSLGAPSGYAINPPPPAPTRRQRMAKEYVLSIDQGTTSSRAMLFQHNGTSAGVAQLEHEQIYPQAGWVEHDPKEIWDKTQQVVAKVLQDNNLTADSIAAVGITNQRETTVVWDKNTGEPVYNAIVWQDTRTQPIVSQWKDEGYEDEIKPKTGLVIATYFSGTKIAWILENVEGARERAERGDLLFGNTDTWVIWNLTGGVNGGRHITDYTNASRTMLFNLENTDWDDGILEKLNIPKAMLPELRPSSDRETYGSTLADGSLGGEVPIAGDAGDQQAALFGQACFDVGQAKNTYGTGNFLLQNTGQQVVPSKSGLLTTGFYALEKGNSFYALEGSIAITGAAVQWLRDNLKMIKDANETEEIAQSVEDSGGAIFVPAFSGLFAPYWDERARGVIVGLTRYVNRAHLVRATLESECWQSRDVVEAVEQDSGKRLEDLRVDGGSVRNNFLMQLQADVLGIPVIRPQVQETTALGAAYLAGLATGYWSSLDEMRENWQVDRTFEPQWSEDQRESGYAQWKKAIERTRGWVD